MIITVLFTHRVAVLTGIELGDLMKSDGAIVSAILTTMDGAAAIGMIRKGLIDNRTDEGHDIPFTLLLPIAQCTAHGAAGAYQGGEKRHTVKVA